MSQLSILNKITASPGSASTSESAEVEAAFGVDSSNDVRPKLNSLFGLGQLIFGDMLPAATCAARQPVAEQAP